MVAPSRPETKLSAGYRLSHFEIVETLGAGGMGVVFKARDLRLGRVVALKVLSPELFENETARGRFIREAQVAASIAHPNVAVVHEIDQDGGVPFIAMELAPGSNLKELIAAGPLPSARVTRIGQQICSALQAAHDVGVVHRDVKSANIMVSPEGEVKVLDFGLAKARALLEESFRLDVDLTPVKGTTVEASPAPLPIRSGEDYTGAGRAVGTPSYMSPEQASGEIATPASDIFSLGVVLYEAASGQLPFRGRSEHEILEAVRTKPAPSLELPPRSLPVELIETINKCLAKKPEDRFRSSQELGEALARVEAGEDPSSDHSRDKRTRVMVGAGVAALLVLVLSWLVPSLQRDTRPPTESARIDLIAVLPFENESREATEDYLAASVPLELTARLGEIGAIKVVPWSFMRQFREQSLSLEDLGKATGADAIVEGSVQLLPTLAAGPPAAEGPTIRVNAQMYRTTGHLIWSENFQASMGNLMTLHAEMARRIAGQIRVKLAQREQVRLSTRRRVEPEAMELYLRGREVLDERTEALLSSSLDYFQAALERDASFAEAHVGLASANVLLTAHYDAIPPGDAYQRAIASTDRALALDPDLADAWAIRGFAEFLLAWDWDRAQEAFDRALALAPNSAWVHHWYADYLTAMGRHAEALEHAQAAYERAPLSPVFNRRLGWTHFFARRNDEAIAHLKRTLELDPDFVPARSLLGRAYVVDGRYDDAIAELTDIGKSLMLAQAYAAAGRNEQANGILEELLPGSLGEGVSPFNVALVYAALGENDRAFFWLERAYEERDSRIVNLKTTPLLDPLRDDSRFLALLQKMSFPP